LKENGVVAHFADRHFGVLKPLGGKMGYDPIFRYS